MVHYPESEREPAKRRNRDALIAASPSEFRACTGALFGRQPLPSSSPAAAARWFRLSHYQRADMPLPLIPIVGPMLVRGLLKPCPPDRRNMGPRARARLVAIAAGRSGSPPRWRSAPSATTRETISRNQAEEGASPSMRSASAKPPLREARKELAAGRSPTPPSKRNANATGKPSDTRPPAATRSCLRLVAAADKPQVELRVPADLLDRPDGPR